MNDRTPAFVEGIPNLCRNHGGKNLFIKSTVFIIIIFFGFQNLFSQEDFQMEIEARHFKLVNDTYHEMEKYGIDLSEYDISIKIENNTLFVLFSNPKVTSISGSSAEYPALIYEVDTISGEIVKVTGLR